MLLLKLLLGYTVAVRLYGYNAVIVQYSTIVQFGTVIVLDKAKSAANPQTFLDDVTSDDIGDRLTTLGCYRNISRTIERRLDFF